MSYWRAGDLVSGAWDGEEFVVTVVVTVMAPATFPVTYRLTAEQAASVLAGEGVEVDGDAHPTTVDWTHLDGASDDELAGVDAAVAEALRAVIARDNDAAAAVEAAADGGEA
jgi:hypothetical protein